ncbi:hypothetical protein BKK56_01780 [Rodentibacter genomosp. 2]|uniref:hypothetical protein n=1 Tax=Rodentibacter genomosp. 2 TaxID=1908266 RepID=UPI0009867B63|nr:hypothetical protein BKK56_01780 [Rodentibacter genomosp. 2]
MVNKTLFFIFSIFYLTGCEKSFHDKFYENRQCPEIKFECLDESKENKMLDTSKPYRLSQAQMDDIRRRETLKVYEEVAKMLDIYYPGFWRDKDKEFQLRWVEEVDNIATRFYGRHERGTLETMAQVCAIIGSDFENNPSFKFIVDKLKTSPVDTPLDDVHDYLRFEVLKKDYSETGLQYNNWSLRGVQDGMPRFSRKVPDFDTEWKQDNQQENVWSIYKRTVREESDL